MARGPQGQYRPNDPIAKAVMVARLATGETTEQEVASRAASERRTPEKTRRVKTLGDKACRANRTGDVLPLDHKQASAT